MLGWKKTLQTRELVDLRGALDGWHDPTIGIGHDGAVYAVARRSSESTRAEHPSGASFPKILLDEPTDHLLVRWRDGELRTTTIPDETLIVSYVQPLGDRVVLAGARCRWRTDGADRNATIVDWDGAVHARLTLGDGIHFLRTTPDARIWAGYFDEGVFGNFGWGGSDGPAPVGAPGLVAFASDGAIARAYDAEAAGTDGICDVYAMNARDADDVWIYFYDSFSIAHVGPRGTKAWKTRIEGARAMAVRDHEVLLVGGYDVRTGARVVTLGKNGVAKTSRRLKLADELATAELHGVGDSLYAVLDGRVLVADAW